MKFASAALAVILAAGLVSCSGTSDDATVTGSTAESVPASEITESELFHSHGDLPEYLSESGSSIFSDIADEYAATGYAPEKYAVLFEDAPTLCLVCSSSKDTDFDGNPKLNNRIEHIYFNGSQFEYEITLFDGVYIDMYYTHDVLALIRQGGSGPVGAIFVSENGMHVTDDRVYEIEVSDGVMYYDSYTTGMYFGMMQDMGWPLVYSADDLYKLGGRIQCSDSGVTLTEESRQTIGEYYDEVYAEHNKEKYGVSTFEEYKIFVERELLISQSPYFRMLSMTPGEIISEFGGMEFKFGFAGTAPAYSVNGFDDMDILYLGTKSKLSEPLASTDIPSQVMIYTDGAEILPGITIGMSSKEFTKLLPINTLNYSLSDYAPGFSSSHTVNGYQIVALWGCPDGFHGLEGLSFLYPDNYMEMREEYTKNYTDAMNNGSVDTPLLGVYISGGKS